MNPREFCRQPGYGSALILTYNFDPLFFERVVLHDLHYGGTGEIVVLADQGQIAEMVPRYAEQLRFLGRSYYLAGAGGQTFHPKIMLRVGRAGMMLWAGTGNVTQCGWGGNRELAAQWQLKPDANLASRLLTDIVNVAVRSCPISTVADAISRFGQVSWLRTTPPGNESPLISSSENLSLAEQLAQRWAGRRYKTLRLSTGSTDRDGAFIRWCGESFGIEKCVVMLNPATAAFDPLLIDALPVETTIAPAAGHQHLHAKFYWFDGPDGAAAVMGSANCSRAAWLLPPLHNGNVETIVVYDDAQPREFGSILSALPSTGLRATAVPGLVPGGRNPVEPQSDGASLAISELILSDRQITAVTNRPIAVGSSVRAVVQGQCAPLYCATGDGRRWEGLVENMEIYGMAMFGKLEVEHNCTRIDTPLHWIHNRDELMQAAHRRVLGALPRDLRDFTVRAEQNQLLKDLAAVAQTLFAEPDAFPDPVPRRRHDEIHRRDQVPVEPGQLIRSLAELEAKAGPMHLGHALPAQISLHGVMAAFFGKLEEDDDARSADDLELMDDDNPDERVDEPTAKPVMGRVQLDQRTLEQQRKRLLKDMERYLANLVAAKFVKSCTATQFTHAAAYPLLVASFGQQSGWLSPDAGRDLILATLDRLFRTEVGDSKSHGLLSAVRSRFEGEGRAEMFAHVVGDGTLWLALIAAVSSLRWSQKTQAILAAIVLEEVIAKRELIETVFPEHLKVLATRLNISGSPELMLRQADAVSTLLVNLQSFFTEHMAQLLQSQLGKEHQVGDLVWRSAGQWGEVREHAMIQPGSRVRVYWRSRGEVALMVSSGAFLNVRLATKQFAIPAKLLRNIEDAVVNERGAERSPTFAQSRPT